MTDKKLNKGKKYYTCQHQELAETSCDTCNDNGMINTTKEDLKCSKCNYTFGDIYDFKAKGEKCYEPFSDVYQNDDKTHTCVKCYEKSKNDSRERETNPTTSNSDC